MPHRLMALNTGQRLAGVGIPVDGLDDLLVAITAGLLGDGPVGGGNLDRFVEVPGGEGPRMMPPVAGFRPIFPEELVGGVAIVADRYMMMPRFGPGVEMIFHDVAIGAGGGIIGQV